MDNKPKFLFLEETTKRFTKDEAHIDSDFSST